jgi:hypothetical protein
LYECIAALFSASERGEGLSEPKPGIPLGPIGKTPRVGPKKRREGLRPSSPKMRLSELFEKNNWICTDEYSSNEVIMDDFKFLTDAAATRIQDSRP